MNQTLKNIAQRRSTRVFKEEQVPMENLKAVLEAGLYAPSAHNQQSWHFTVVQDKELLNELNRESKNAALSIPEPAIQKMATNEKFNIFYNAPTAIIISGDEKAMMPDVDCAAATQTMLIAAESLGLAFCWIGLVTFLFNGSKSITYKEKLLIPEGYQPYYAIALGYRKNEVPAAPSRKENCVTYL